jgi:hypothetical protein
MGKIVFQHKKFVKKVIIFKQILFMGRKEIGTKNYFFILRSSAGRFYKSAQLEVYVLKLIILITEASHLAKST